MSKCTYSINANKKEAWNNILLSRKQKSEQKAFIKQSLHKSSYRNMKLIKQKNKIGDQGKNKAEDLRLRGCSGPREQWDKGMGKTKVNCRI